MCTYVGNAVCGGHVTHGLLDDPQVLCACTYGTKVIMRVCCVRVQGVCGGRVTDW